MERCRLVFSGSGGQGVITAAIIVAEAAVLHEGLTAVQSQTYGPEARGGATRSDVIIADGEINYPRVTHPNVLVSLTQQAYEKFYPIIRPGGLLITDSHFVKTGARVDAVQMKFPMYQMIMEKIGTPIVLNTCMLGTVIELTGLVKPQSIQKILHQRIAARHLAMNLEALALGLQMAKSSRA